MQVASPTKLTLASGAGRPVMLQNQAARPEALATSMILPTVNRPCSPASTMMVKPFSAVLRASRWSEMASIEMGRWGMVVLT